ncbi:c-type cytochrome [Pirellulales bacterium]|nr:c-type cytochrome [Pirellulales bacterium]
MTSRCSKKIFTYLFCFCLFSSFHNTSAADQTWKQNRVVMPIVTAGQSDDSEQDRFHVLAGYQVEKLFDVPRDELGSWVSLTSDPQGRLYACDQQEKGLVRITPATLDGSTETVVQKVPAALSGAQGLLWAFDSLYAVCNGSGFHGLFRLTDSDGDSLLDHVEKLHDIAPGGEHGAHNILLSPDGKRLFIICGNHTKLPFAVTNVTEPQTMGGIRSNQRRVSLAADGTSRLPANWDEDQIIPRMWDGNGHATGKLAPGGYIVSTDPEGKSWELWSAGYRNPYDFGFNADGEIFAYDADMEWDFGMPWYRPTRVNHATSGSELGWRSGTAKWPAAYPDSLPAMVDIGPGSPVGAAFGYGAKVPAQYQKAFYICDWTFGTMYAIHLTPSGSTYTAEKEEFVSRNALPLTDMTVSKDGAIYFAVGGRGGQSELYRVTYIGNEATDPVDAKDAVGAAERNLRRQLEAFHAPQKNPSSAIEMALKNLGHTDRFIRYAARIVLEHQPVDAWQTKALASSTPAACINGAIAVARQAKQSAQSDVLAALERVPVKNLDKDRLLDLIRAYELALIRLGEPTAVVKQQLAEKFAPLFPAGPKRTQPRTTQQSDARWIWSNDQAQSPLGEELTFQKTFSLTEPVAAAHLVASTDNGGDIFLNGKEVASCKDWMYPVSKAVTTSFKAGPNTIRVSLKNLGGPAALKVSLRIRYEDGRETVIDSDDSWEWTSGRFEGTSSNEQQWKHAAVTRSQTTWAQTDSVFTKNIHVADVKDEYRELNRALSSLLVAVRAPGIVSKLIGLLSTDGTSSQGTNLGIDQSDIQKLAKRNAGYGRAVTGVLENRTNLLQIHYGYILRTVNEKSLWSLADRKAYFTWLDQARTWSGGNSYRKFLVNIESESLNGLSENEKLALETLGARKPYVAPPLPKPEGPGQKWTLDSVLASVKTGMKKNSRNFAHGKKTFAAARCIVCHRFDGDGGATGPDLTQAAGRFKMKDLVESMIHPSKVVSDQYQAHVIQTVQGKVYTGRIVNETGNELTVVTDPENATKFVVLKRSDIEEMLPANQSLMPAGLLDQLNEEEVLDLLAYTLSRGKGRGPNFK